MHIPDGFLSPSTSIAFYIFSAPFISKASTEIQKKVDAKTVPLVSLFAALSFLIMMFNIPLPGGTTGHAVGTTIASIVLGPWIAMLATSVALVIQALFFGDGGILSLGANVFNMAIVIALVGSGIYSLLSRWAKADIRKQTIAAAIAGYLAINVSAILTAIELGIQPLLFHTATGQAEYFPYGLKAAIPAMMIGHLTIAGLAEAFVTGIAFSWIHRTNPQLLHASSERTTTSATRLFVLLGVLILLTPIGLLAPGTAWGEWGRDELTKLGLPYIPAGFDRWSSFWHAPFPDYDRNGFLSPSFMYILSGCIGVAVTIGVMYLIFWLLRKRKDR